MNESISQPPDSQLQLPEVHTVAKYDFIVEFGAEDEDEWEHLEFEILEAVRHSVEEDFANEVQHLFQGLVNVRIERIEHGSIVGTVALILAAGVSLYEFLAQYRDLYDSLVLLRQHLRAIINRVLRHFWRGRRYPGYRVNVALSRVPILKPTLPAKPRRVEPPPLYSKAFFWYLFFMNLLLMAIITGLVYRAVAVAYFRAP